MTQLLQVEQAEVKGVDEWNPWHDDGDGDLLNNGEADDLRSSETGRHQICNGNLSVKINTHLLKLCHEVLSSGISYRQLLAILFGTRSTHLTCEPKFLLEADFC